jgi:hypothetical protein
MIDISLKQYLRCLCKKMGRFSQSAHSISYYQEILLLSNQTLQFHS